MLSSFLNELALKNAHLLNDEKLETNEIHLACTIQPTELNLKKTASNFFFERIDQFVDMHQNSQSPDLWLVKSGKVVRAEGDDDAKK